MTEGRRGALLACASAVLFGSSYVATAFALRSVGALPIAAWRAGLAAACLATWLVLSGVRSRGRAAALPGDSGAVSSSPGANASRLARLAVLGLMGGLVFIAAMNLAVAGAGATVSAFVAGLYAVVGAVLAIPLLAEPLSAGALLGFGVSLVGTALLAELDPGRVSASGLAAGLVAATSYGLFLVLSRRWSRPLRLSPTVVSLSNNAMAAVGLLVILAVAGGGSAGAAIVPATVRPEAVLAIGWLVVVAVAGQVLVVEAVRRLDARRSSAFLLLNPIAATILALLLLGERLDVRQVAGGFLVLVGMAVATGTAGAVRDIVRGGG